MKHLKWLNWPSAHYGHSVSTWGLSSISILYTTLHSCAHMWCCWPESWNLLHWIKGCGLLQRENPKIFPQLILTTSALSALLPAPSNHTPTQEGNECISWMRFSAALFSPAGCGWAGRGRRGLQTSLCLKKQVSVTAFCYMKPLNGKPPLVAVYMIYLASSQRDKLVAVWPHSNQLSGLRSLMERPPQRAHRSHAL